MSNASVINRAYLQKLFTDNKTNQVNQIITTILNNIRNTAASGNTSYLHDTTRTKFGSSGAASHVRGVPVQNCMTPLPELIALLKTKLNDCNVSYQETATDNGVAVIFSGTTVDASGNIIDSNGIVPVSGTIVKKGILISWA
jgi:hypothetical protein